MKMKTQKKIYCRATVIAALAARSYEAVLIDARKHNWPSTTYRNAHGRWFSLRAAEFTYGIRFCPQAVAAAAEEFTVPACLEIEDEHHGHQ